MRRALAGVLLGAAAVACWAAKARADRAQTVYTMPNEIPWREDTGAGVPRGSYYAVMHGEESDACGQVYLVKFPDGFVYPWHVNDAAGLYTVLKGTLVIGFDKDHAKSGERALPTGAIMDGLATEPHYGRAEGETIFEVVMHCPVPQRQK